jgi:hypothetical protein
MQPTLLVILQVWLVYEVAAALRLCFGPKTFDALQTVVGVQILVRNGSALNSATAATANTLLLFLTVSGVAATAVAAHVRASIPVLLHLKLLLLRILMTSEQEMLDGWS